MQFFLPHLLKRSPRSRSEALSASRCICTTRVLVRFLTGRRAHIVGPPASPPPPRARVSAVAHEAPRVPGARSDRRLPSPTCGTHPRARHRHRRHDHAWDARVDARPRAAHACDRPHHDATCRRHSFTPHEQISRMPMPLGASGTQIGDRAHGGGLDEASDEARRGSTRRRRSTARAGAHDEAGRPHPRRPPRRLHGSGRPHLPAAACAPADLDGAPFSLA